MRREGFSGLDQPRESGHGLSQFTGQERHAHRSFAMQRLGINTTFPRDDEISRRDSSAQVNEVRDQIKAAREFGSAKGHEAKAKPTRRSGSGNLGGIHAEIPFDNVCQSFEAAFKVGEVFHTLLGSVNSRTTFRSEQWIRHIAGDENLAIQSRERRISKEFRWRTNLRKLIQITRQRLEICIKSLEVDVVIVVKSET